MSSPKTILIKESITELKKLQKGAIPMIANRIRVLIELKKNEKAPLSKRAVADLVGVNHNSVQTWRKLYEQGGIEAVLFYQKQPGRPSDISPAEHQLIEKKLNDPKNGLRGYVELLTWMETEFKKEFKYNTVLKYSYRHFQSKIKVARKSHVNKDEEAVATFKKTSVRPVNKSLKTKGKALKR
jgi:transposase